MSPTRAVSNLPHQPSSPVGACFRYFSPPPAHLAYPPEVHEYNDKFTQLLQRIKQRHDPTVTTIAQGVLEWKKKIGGDVMGRDVQGFLDRFYMSR